MILAWTEVIKLGFRMSIVAADEIYPGDHKFYGYVSFDDVKGSFSFLYPFIKKQWNYDWDWGDDIDIAYDIFCCISSTDPLILTESEFKEFIELYLHDLLSYTIKYDYVEEHLKMLCDIPGNKSLYWN